MIADEPCGLDGSGVRHHVVAVDVDQRKRAPARSRSAVDQRFGDKRRRCPLRPHQRGRSSVGRQHDIAGKLAPVGHHRRNADAPADASVGQVDQVLADFGVQFPGVDVGPRAATLLVARLGGVGVVGRGEHRVRDLAHPPAVESHRGIEQHQARDQFRPGGGQLQGDRAAERMANHHNRFAGSGTSDASAATLASMVHGADHGDRPWPIRSGAATATSGRCPSASVCQRRPWPVNPWTARTRGDPGGP